jgi:peptidoglycan/LPS O-acetylase OafA/YrhL
MKPWMRFGPYVVGLWAGFILYKTANKRLRLPPWAVLGGWLLSTTTALAIIYGIIPWYDPEIEIHNGLGGFYAGFHRFAWGMVISWIVFACVRGYGGPVNTFLSWKVFMPLGRLTFCVYLISYSLQTLYHFSIRQPTVYDAYSSVN